MAAAANWLAVWQLPQALMLTISTKLKNGLPHDLHNKGLFKILAHKNFNLNEVLTNRLFFLSQLNFLSVDLVATFTKLLKEGSYRSTESQFQLSHFVFIVTIKCYC